MTLHPGLWHSILVFTLINSRLQSGQTVGMYVGLIGLTSRAMERVNRTEALCGVGALPLYFAEEEMWKGVIPYAYLKVGFP